MSNAPRSRPFIVTSPVVLEEDTRRACVVREKGELQTKYWPSWYQHNPTIPDPYASVLPIKVEGIFSNSRRWVGLLARLRTNSRQASSSSCISVVSWMCRPAALLRACYTRVNIPLDTATAGMMFHISLRSFHHLHREVVRAFLGMATSAAATFSCCLGERRSRWEIVYRSHLRTILWVDHAPYPCTRLFREMGYLRLVSASSLA